MPLEFLFKPLSRRGRDWPVLENGHDTIQGNSANGDRHEVTDRERIAIGKSSEAENLNARFQRRVAVAIKQLQIRAVLESPGDFAQPARMPCDDTVQQTDRIQRI